MRKLTLLGLIALYSHYTFSQNNGINVGLLGGINKTLIGSASKIGNTSGIKVGVVFHKSQSRFFFEPSASILLNQYFSTDHLIVANANDFFYIKISQFTFCLMPSAGFLITKNIKLKVGFFIQPYINSRLHQIRYSTTSPYPYYAYTREDIYEHYDPNKIQAGMIAGLEMPIDKKQKLNFELSLMQFGTSFIQSDYFIRPFTSGAESTLVFNNKSKPTVLLIGFNFKIK